MTRSGTRSEKAFCALVIAGQALSGVIPSHLRMFLDPLMLALFIAALAAAWSGFWRAAPALFVLGSAIGFLFELVGLSTGVPFGRYEYVGLARPTIAGVPIPVVIAWGLYTTVAYLCASATVRRRLSRILLASAYMVILDLGLDPVLVEAGLWRWVEAGVLTWYGVPITNFIGWYVVSATTLTIYEVAAGGDRPRTSIRWLPQATYLVSYIPVTKIGVEHGQYQPVIISLAIAVVATVLVGLVSRVGTIRLEERAYSTKQV